MNELHLFSGAGGGILGGILLGHTPVCAVEISPFRRKTLLQRQRDGMLPWFPIWDDIRTFDGNPWRGCVDVVCGGFPCKDISAANQYGEGIDGKHSGLWSEMRRIICEVRPKCVFVENSPVLVVRGLGRVLGDLASMGFDARWGVLGAKHAGAQHARERIWIFAYTNGIGWGRGRYAKEQSWKGIQSPRLVGQPGPWEEEAGKKARILGVGDGVANTVDRIEACGAGQVPAVVKLAWETLM